MMEGVTYKINEEIKVEDIISVLADSGINRPIADTKRIEKMYKNSNLVISAWHNGKLIGIARSLTDWSFDTYLADLAVCKDFQHMGIGKKMIELTRREISDQSMLLLLAAPSAVEYYPKIGMEKIENSFIFRRKS